MRVDTTYEDFLRRKVRVAAKHGFAVQAEDVHPILLPHQRDAVRWACAGGRRALFEAVNDEAGEVERAASA